MSYEDDFDEGSSLGGSAPPAPRGGAGRRAGASFHDLNAFRNSLRQPPAAESDAAEDHAVPPQRTSPPPAAAKARGNNAEASQAFAGFRAAADFDSGNDPRQRMSETKRELHEAMEASGELEGVKAHLRALLVLVLRLAAFEQGVRLHPVVSALRPSRTEPRHATAQVRADARRVVVALPTRCRRP